MTLLSRREFVRFSGKAFAFCLLPYSPIHILKNNSMIDNKTFDVIIIGGSYAGLAAGMALGRASKKTLIIDNGNPCNKQTPYSHNFLTNDGKSPSEITSIANHQVSNYDTVHFLNETAIDVVKSMNGFNVRVGNGESFETTNLIFATGIKDLLPPIKGVSECWGISVLHCPYCHGYEIRNVKTGILGNGDTGFEFVKLISNWTKDLTVFTNGDSSFTFDQKEKLHKHHIQVVENKIEQLEQYNGHVKNILFEDGTTFRIEAIYAPSPFEQHCKIPEIMGCEITDDGYIKIDHSFETTIKGVFAIGDNATKIRTVANAVAMGTQAGMTISKRMILDEF